MKPAGGNIYGPLKARREPEVNKFSGLRLEDLQGGQYSVLGLRQYQYSNIKTM